MPIPKKKEVMQRQTAKEKVYCQMRDWIIDGTLQPNEKIYDSEIAEFFSVSRTPVREAFQMLATQQLIQVIPGKATVVTEVKFENIKEWYLPLIRLQCLAVELAMPKMGEKDFRYMESLNKKLKEAIEAYDVKGILKRDKQFHDYIINLSGNHYIKSFSDLLHIHIQRAETIFYTYTKTVRRSTDDHERIIAQMRKGDVAGATREMEANWINTVKEMEEILQEEKV